MPPSSYMFSCSFASTCTCNYTCTSVHLYVQLYADAPMQQKTFDFLEANGIKCDILYQRKPDILDLHELRKSAALLKHMTDKYILFCPLHVLICCTRT